MHWGRKAAAYLFAAMVLVITTWSLARNSYRPQPPTPDVTHVVHWIITGKNPVAAGTAVFAAISAAYSIWQMFQIPAATRPDVRKASQEVKDASKKESAELKALLVSIIEMLTAGGVPRETVKSYEATTGGFIASNKPEDANFAREALENPVGLSITLVEQARSARKDSVLNFLKAARVAAPFAPSRAIEIYKEALEVDPRSGIAWVELGRLYKNAGLVASAADCVRRAVDLNLSPPEKMEMLRELSALLAAEGDLSGARNALEKSSEIFRILHHEDQLSDECFEHEAILYSAAANVALADGETDKAEKFYTHNAGLRGQMWFRNKDDYRYWHSCIMANSELGRVALQREDDYRALTLFEEAASELQQLLDEDNKRHDVRSDHAKLLLNVSHIESHHEDYERALRLADSAAADYELMESAVGRSAGAWTYRWAAALSDAGSIGIKMGENQVGLDRLQRGLNIISPLAEQTDADIDIKALYVELTGRIGAVLPQMGYVKEGQDKAELSLRMQENIYRTRSGDSEYYYQLGIAHSNYSTALSWSDVDKAIEQVIKATEVFSKLSELRPDVELYQRALENSFDIHKQLLQRKGNDETLH